MLKVLLLAAVIFLLLLTPDGLQHSADAQVYIEAANTIHEGMWFDGAPMVHFPPLFVVVIAALGLDVLRVLHALVYAANIGLMRVLMVDAGVSRRLALIVSAFIGISGGMIYVHTHVLSEPIFLLLTLLTVLALGRGRWGAAVVFAALAGLQRFSGIVLSGVIFYALLADCGGLCGAGRLAARIVDAAKRDVIRQRGAAAGVASGDGGCADRRGDGAGTVADSAGVRDRTRQAAGTFVAVYLAFLVVSISLFDATTPLDERILLPVLPMLWIVTAPNGQ